MTNSYIFNKGYYFPLNFRLTGYFGMIIGAAMSITDLFYFGIPILLICAVPALLIQKLRLDPVNKKIKSYNELIGLEFGKSISFNVLKGLKIKSGIESQNISLRANSMNLEQKMYYARLYFDRKSVLLQSSGDKEMLENKMNELSRQLHIPLILP
jgi:hypothetical protein